MLALYLLYHRHLPQEDHRSHSEEFLAGHISAFDNPSMESLVCHVILGESPDWKLEDLENSRREYLKQRNCKHCLRLGHIFEAAMTITSAEAYRAAGRGQHGCHPLRPASIFNNLRGPGGLQQARRGTRDLDQGGRRSAKTSVGRSLDSEAVDRRSTVVSHAGRFFLRSHASTGKLRLVGLRFGQGQERRPELTP